MILQGILNETLLKDVKLLKSNILVKPQVHIVIELRVALGHSPVEIRDFLMQSVEHCVLLYLDRRYLLCFFLWLPFSRLVLLFYYHLLLNLLFLLFTCLLVSLSHLLSSRLTASPYLC